MTVRVRAFFSDYGILDIFVSVNSLLDTFGACFGITKHVSLHEAAIMPIVLYN